MSSYLEQQIEGLRRMSREQLKIQWRDLYRAAPPIAFTPDLLARGIAWRLQVSELGGLPPHACQMFDGSGEAAPRRRRVRTRLSLRPGNRLVRRWRGRTYVVEAALKALLDDVTAGRVDVIVIYKIDRLTRSLADFARIVEQLEKANASFVSVTQGAERVAALIDVVKGDAFDMKRVGGIKRGVVTQRIDKADLARRLLGLVPNAWLAMDLVRNAVSVLLDRARGDEATVANIRLNLVGDMRERLGAAIQDQAKAAFDRMVKGRRYSIQAARRSVRKAELGIGERLFGGLANGRQMASRQA